MDDVVHMRLIEIEKQMAGHTVLISKFDIALDKISEVSQNVSKLLAVHEERLESQEEAAKELPLLLENRRLEVNQQVSDLYDRIHLNEQELRKDMTNGQKEILEEIKNLRNDLTHQTEALKTELKEDFQEEIQQVSGRVSKLERLVYIAIGGASVLGLIISEIVTYFGGGAHHPG